MFIKNKPLKLKISLVLSYMKVLKYRNTSHVNIICRFTTVVNIDTHIVIKYSYRFMQVKTNKIMLIENEAI